MPEAPMHAMVSRQPVLQMRDVWTVADLETLDLPEWWRYEIVDGALVVSPSRDRWHEFVSAELRAMLWAALPPELTVLGPVGVAVGRSYRIPDLVVVARSTRDRPGPFAASDLALAVEIVSPGSQTMDRVMKPAEYAAAGIDCFWRVETDPLSLSAHRLDGATYRLDGTWEMGRTAVLTAPFPVEIEIARLAG